MPIQVPAPSSVGGRPPLGPSARNLSSSTDHTGSGPNRLNAADTEGGEGSNPPIHRPPPRTSPRQAFPLGSPSVQRFGPNRPRKRQPSLSPSGLSENGPAGLRDNPPKFGGSRSLITLRLPRRGLPDPLKAVGGCGAALESYSWLPGFRLKPGPIARAIQLIVRRRVPSRAPSRRRS